MIIDCILDRKCDEASYDPHKFYIDMVEYGEYYGEKIAHAMDYGTEPEVRFELCRYVLENEYSPAICNYINRKKWLTA